MTHTNIKIKKLHPNAVVPAYATPGAACFDITCFGVPELALGLARHFIIAPRSFRIFRTGLAFEIPEGWRLDVFSRSGRGFKQSLRLVNCTGKIDSDYRGELLIGLHNDSNEDRIITIGERIAQGEINPVYRANFEVVEELSTTERGEGGFGSTNKA
jgi:dUTP pyrophosphatase